MAITRKQYARQYERYQRQVEAKYTNAFYRALQAQIKPIIDFVRDNPNIANIPAFRLDSSPIEVVLRRLYRTEVPKYANIVTRYLRTQIVQKAFGLNYLWLERVNQWLGQFGGEFITTITNVSEDYMKLYVRDILDRAASEQMSISETVKLLTNKFKELNRTRARRIARTETNGALNFAGKIAAEQSGLQLQKVWLATADARTRDQHVRLNGQSVPMDQPFEATDRHGRQVLLDHPGDKSARSPESTINCRCTLMYEPVRDEQGNLL